MTVPLQGSPTDSLNLVPKCVPPATVFRQRLRYDRVGKYIPQVKRYYKVRRYFYLAKIGLDSIFGARLSTPVKMIPVSSVRSS